MPDPQLQPLRRTRRGRTPQAPARPSAAPHSQGLARPAPCPSGQGGAGAPSRQWPVSTPLQCAGPSWGGQSTGCPSLATPGGSILLPTGLATPLRPRRAPDQPRSPQGPALGQRCPSQTRTPRPWEWLEGPERGGPQPGAAPRSLQALGSEEGVGPCQGPALGVRRGVSLKAAAGPGAPSPTCPGPVGPLGKHAWGPGHWGHKEARPGRRRVASRPLPRGPAVFAAPGSPRPPGVTAPWAGSGRHGNWRPGRHAAW